MKNVQIILIVLWLCGISCAQDKKFELQDVCGDPRAESTIWRPFGAEVTKIINGQTLSVKQNKGKNKIIDLVAVNSNSDQTNAKDFLTKMLLNKYVVFWLPPAKSYGKRVTALVWLGEKQVNRLMIEQGISAYQEPPPYSLSNYFSCVYKVLGEKAKEEKIGIWAK